MNKHTPAPWFTDGDLSTALDIQSSAGRIAMIDECSDLTDEQITANARLIEAAPLMLAALQRITHPAADDSDHAHALEIIAQATGKATP